MNVRVQAVTARFGAAFSAAYGEVRERPLLVVALRGADGVVGLGEAAPLEAYDGVSIADVRAALADCVPALRDSDGADRASVLDACREAAVLPQAVAAVDLALWDLAGRRAREPVWRLLGSRDPAPVDVNWTIGAVDRAGAATEASRALDAGFGCVKVKVGVGDDAGRLAAVRAASGGRPLTIRIDANGAWSAAEAIAALRALAPVGIELCEEPAAGLEAIRRVWSQDSGVPIALDESAVAPGAVDERCGDSVCLKVARCGGITGVLDQAARARAAGYDVYLASTFDGPLGIAAALHAAAVIQPRRACGLATLALLEGGEEVLPARRGRIAVPGGPGLGDGLREWYAGAGAPPWEVT